VRSGANSCRAILHIASGRASSPPMLQWGAAIFDMPERAHTHTQLTTPHLHPANDYAMLPCHPNLLLACSQILKLLQAFHPQTYLMFYSQKMLQPCSVAKLVCKNRGKKPSMALQPQAEPYPLQGQDMAMFSTQHRHMSTCCFTLHCIIHMSPWNALIITCIPNQRHASIHTAICM
jgi:hypothetical protein